MKDYGNKNEHYWKEIGKERKQKKIIMARWLYEDKYSPNMSYDEIIDGIKDDLSSIYGEVSRKKVIEYLFGKQIDKLTGPQQVHVNKLAQYLEIKFCKEQFPLLSQKRLAEHFKVSVSTIKRALRS